MKKYINVLVMFFLTILVFTSCKEEAGTVPGTDGTPVITLYQYAAEAPEYNPDNDLRIRVAANSQVSEAYYLVEPVTDKTERIKDLGETGYMIYVLDNGEKIEGISGASNADIMVTDVQGQCAITVVGTNGSNMSSKEVLFNGLTWNDVVTGTYVFGTKSIQGGAAADIVGKTSVPTTLQVCTTNPDLYRFKDVFGTGYSMKINLIDLKGSDKDGKEYQYFR